ncbi:MAG: carbon-nitrogen hydrolase family protein [Bryobacterales bacterium]|nr:carbon-nitrogen hydrolase family protein [Bryobacterales bacterium]
MASTHQRAHRTGRACVLLAVLLLPGSAVGRLRVIQSGFPDSGEPPPGWTTWAARPEIAPRMFLDATHYRKGPASLAVSGNSNAAAYGGWEYAAGGVEPGKWYRLQAYYRAEGVPQEQLQIVARLDWRSAGGRAGQPDYAWKLQRDGEWRQISLEAPAPARAVSVRIQLYLANAPQGTVWWDAISLEEIPDPGPRTVTIASINLQPRNTGSAESSVSRFLETVDSSVTRADLILLPEGITVVGTGKKYAEVAETIPGPTVSRLAAMARRKNAYIAAGLYEREGIAIYNTAVLIGRKGELVGKYRKVYLPREEIEGGLTPGNDYPVFRTDFGTVGLMICWDVQYTDPARELARRGAEILLLPIWGGNLALGKARAIENHVFLVSSGYGYPTQVLDPNGEILAQAAEQGRAATATIDLNKRYLDEWLGDMRGRFMKELRTDLR